MNGIDQTYKIAIVGDCLGQGGAEKVHAILSQYFISKNIDVHNIIVDDLITYQFAGKLFVLSHFKNKNNSAFNKFYRFLKLRSYVSEHKFDVIIDFRMKQFVLREMLIARFVYKVPTIYIVSSSILEFYIPKSSLAARFIYKNKKVATVSQRITAEAEKVLHNEIKTIYNPLDFNEIERMSIAFVPLENNYIIAVGRMNDHVKQFHHLIEAYAGSDLQKQNIKLLLLGDGQNRNQYEQLATELGLNEYVVFKGFCENPYAYMRHALFTVLSSRNEGFPNVLIESLAVETPVVAYDCFTGPGEIITDRENGLLVENQSVEKLTDAMNLFIENKPLYNHCKSNAAQSVQRFSLDIIGRQWFDFMKINVS